MRRRRLSQQQFPSVFTPINAIADGDSLSSSQVWASTSTSKQRRAAGYITHLAAQCFQIFNLKETFGAYGNSGDTIDNILSSQPTAITFANANNVKAVFLLLGTNDVENVARTTAAIIADYATVIQNYLSCTSEPFVFVGLPLPRADWEGDTEPTRASFVTRLHELRSGLNTLISATLASDRLLKFDAYNDIVDSSITNPTTGLTYFPKAGFLQSDGVHLQPPGADIVGQRASEAFKSTPLWVAPTALPSNAGAINTNYSLSGTSGTKGTGVTGDVADGCAVIRGSGSPTAVCSKETISIHGISMMTQKIVVTGASAIDEEIYFVLDSPEKTGASYAFNGAVGLEMVTPIRVSDINNTQMVYTHARADSTTTHTTYDMAFVTGNRMPNTTREWLLRSEPLTVPAGNPTRQQILVRIRVDGSVPGASCTVNIGPSFYRQAIV